MKLRPVGAELLLADGRTDGRTDMKQIVAFRNFANAPKSSPSTDLERPRQFEELQTARFQNNRNVGSPKHWRLS